MEVNFDGEGMYVWYVCMCIKEDYEALKYINDIFTKEEREVGFPESQEYETWAKNIRLKTLRKIQIFPRLLLLL